MSCHARHCRPCVLSKGGDVMPRPDVVHPCVLSQGVDGMPRSKSFDHVSRPRAMMACHTRRRLSVSASQKAMMVCHASRHSTLFAVQGILWPATPDFVRPCVVSKGHDGMPRPSSFDRVCCPKAMMAFHARRRSTVFDVQGRKWHATPDAVRPFVLPKGDDGMPCPASFDRVCCPKAVMACHA